MMRPLTQDPLQRQPLTLLCVGRLGRHKGQEWLVDVYRRARPQFQRPVRLVLVGRDEGDQQQIADAVREAGLEDEVSMVGEVSDEELGPLVRPIRPVRAVLPVRGLRLGVLRSDGLRRPRPDPRRRRQP